MEVGAGVAGSSPTIDNFLYSSSLSAVRKPKGSNTWVYRKMCR